MNKNNKLTKAISKAMMTILILMLLLTVFTELINAYDKKYWESQGKTWERDCEFFGIENKDKYDFKKYTSDDTELREASLELLQCVINNKPFENDRIVIDKENFEHLQTDLKYIDAFYVVQIDDKAAVTFRYSAKNKELEKAIKDCVGSYKTYPYDKIYLEKTDGKWVVADVFRQP